MKTINEYPDYKVTSTGEVYSNHHNIFLKKRLDNSGYYFVNLYKNKKMKSVKVHRLVAKAFIPNSDNLPCVNHKNEIKTDNRMENLEWCSYKYNNNYGHGIAKRVEKQRVSIRGISKSKTEVNFDSFSKAAVWLKETLGLSTPVSSIVCGISISIKNRHFYYGYKWYKTSGTHKQNHPLKMVEQTDCL